MTLYLDTSTLVKLYLSEPGSLDVMDMLDGADAVATCVVTYAEARAALARRRRDKTLSTQEFARSRDAFEADWAALVTIDVTEPLVRRAGGLAEQYGLRAYDGIQLAAYEQVALDAGVDHTIFSSADAALTRAAKALARTL